MTSTSLATSPLLSARALAVRAGGRTLVAGLDLDVLPGELLWITGPNGTGKSTLLRVLLGLARPAAGSVTRTAGPVGYVPQLDPSDAGLPFPAAAIVAQGLARGRAGDREAVRATLDRVGFRAPPGRRYTVLSGGERRRVLLARALVGAPALLALDEPTAGVDVAGEQEVVDLVLDEVRGRGAGAIWVGHGIRALEAASTRVLDIGARP